MEGLRVQVRNYKAIAEADVCLADLTVLSGVNASGKSTLARLFHHTVEVNRNFDAAAATAAFAPVKPLFRELFLLLLDLRTGIPTQWKDDLFLWCIDNATLTGADLSQIRKTINLLLGSDAVRDELTKDPRPLAAFNRATGLQVKTVEDLHQCLADSIETAIAQSEQYVRRDDGPAANSPFFSWDEGADIQATLANQATASLRITDSDAPIFDSSAPTQAVGKLYDPKRSLYIRQPAVTLPVLDKDGVRLGATKSLYPIDNAQRPTSCFADFADGSFEPPEGRARVRQQDWIYRRRDNQTFPLAVCAEGIKSLAALQLLDTLGLLDSTSLLIIDEPEVHLHPQWIVDCARALVNLVKTRRVRVLVTSHSPYLIQALHHFAGRELEKEHVCFYLAEPAEGRPFLYTYRNLGNRIGPIFKSFNVALDRIAFYSSGSED